MKRSLEQAVADPGVSETQERNLRRVNLKIASLVVEFCQRYTGTPLQSLTSFTASGLEEWVRFESDLRGIHVTPGSAMRILRNLRQAGVIDYINESRSESRYRILDIDTSKL
jgi:hypothetical protein